MKKKAIIIGSGIGGLGSACLLGKAGWDVTVYEKNEQVGGRASQFSVSLDDIDQHKSADAVSADRTDTAVIHRPGTFRFDMGPSWYLMPDIFKHFFELLGENIHDHLKLVRLSPSYRVFYKDTFVKIDIHSDLAKDIKTIDQMEPGAGAALERYLAQASYQYEIAKDRFMYKNYDSVRDFFTREMAVEGRKLNVLSTMDKHVKKYFKSDAMQKLMQYPLVFLGSSPYNTPAIYNIMSHIDFNMGVYYPSGGMHEVVKALRRIAEGYGVNFKLDTPVSEIIVENSEAVGVMASGKEQKADIVISNADVHHTERMLLQPQYRTKSERYWRTRTMAPSALIMYLGVKGKIPDLTHHNLLFSKNWKKNFKEIFDTPKWPTDPSLYICNPSKTDPTVAPKGYENLFVLVPIAPGLVYDNAQLDTYADKILETIEKHMYIKDLRKRIVYRKLFCSYDFAKRYNSYKGSALGLAHTLRQTAIFRPNNISKKVDKLYYVGAGTNPGIGMPTALISSELMYKRLIDDKSAGPLTPDQL